MQVRIRQRSVADNFGLVFQLVGRHFFPLLLIQSIVIVPSAAATLYIITADIESRPEIGALVYGASLLIVALVQPVAVGASIAVVASSFTGQKTGLGRALGIAIRRLVRLIGYALTVIVLTGLCLLGVFIPIAIVGGLTGAVEHENVWFTVISGLLAVGVGVYVYTTFLMGNCAIVLEDAGIGRALARSRTLVKGRRWSVLGLLLLVGVVAYFLLGIAGAAIGGFVAASPGIRSPVVYQLMQSGISGIGGLFMTVAPIVLYFSLRAEKDGFDVEQLASLVDRIGRLRTADDAR